MQATLVSLLALSASVLAIPSAPAPSHKFTCKDSAEGFAWSVTQFSYNTTSISTTPSHVNYDGEVAFNISNPGLASSQSSSGCFASSAQYPDYFLGNVVYTCIDPETSSNTKTAFTFDSKTSLLSINQSWTCPDATSPISFFASGSVNLTLAHGKSVYNNPDWQLGEIYANNSVISTAPALVPVTAFQISAVA